MHRILTTRQSARALLAIHDYFSRLRALSSLWLARPREWSGSWQLVDSLLLKVIYVFQHYECWICGICRLKSNFPDGWCCSSDFCVSCQTLYHVWCTYVLVQCNRSFALCPFLGSLEMLFINSMFIIIGSRCQLENSNSVSEIISMCYHYEILFIFVRRKLQIFLQLLSLWLRSWASTFSKVTSF